MLLSHTLAPAPPLDLARAKPSLQSVAPGLHTGSGANNWNGAWRAFFKGNPTAKRQEILDQLYKMVMEAFM